MDLEPEALNIMTPMSERTNLFKSVAATLLDPLIHPSNQPTASKGCINGLSQSFQLTRCYLLLN